jgi:hypothetical protein
MALPKAEPRADPEAVVRQIVMEHPQSNASQIKALAKPLGVSKHQVDAVLGNGEYSIESGKGAAKLYSLIDGRVSDFPDPRVEKTGKSEGPTG